MRPKPRLTGSRSSHDALTPISERALRRSTTMPYVIKEKKTLPKSRMELVLEIEAETIAKKRELILGRLKKETELPGFRKGFVPEKIIRERRGELALWEEAAADALSESLAECFRAEALPVIGRPEVSATKIAPDNPAGFRVALTLLPKPLLPDYKTLAAEENKRPLAAAVVEDKEVGAVIEEIVRHHKKEAGKEGFVLSDETAKELGPFAGVADLRDKIKEELLRHKGERAKEKRRARLLERLTEETRAEVPELLITHELNRLESEWEAELAAGGGSFEAYLTEIKKDRETVRNEWRQDAERRARLYLALAEIARAERIAPAPEEVTAEVKRILLRRTGATEEDVRAFVENAILNQKVIQFLEEQKEPAALDNSAGNQVQ